MGWLTKNWDKVIAVSLSTVVAGVVGFYSAILSITTEIVRLDKDIVEMKGEIQKSVVPRLEELEENANRLEVLEHTVIKLNADTNNIHSWTRMWFGSVSMMYFAQQGGQPPVLDPNRTLEQLYRSDTESSTPSATDVESVPAHAH